MSLICFLYAFIMSKEPKLLTAEDPLIIAKIRQGGLPTGQVSLDSAIVHR